METQENTKKEASTSQKNNTTAQNNSFDYSKAEITNQNIVIPDSQFQAKYTKENGYAVGIEGVRLTKYHKTLEKALNEIGYGVEKDEEDDEILVKTGEVDFEMVARIAKAIFTIMIENYGKENN